MLAARRPDKQKRRLFNVVDRECECPYKAPGAFLSPAYIRLKNEFRIRHSVSFGGRNTEFLCQFRPVVQANARDRGKPLRHIVQRLALEGVFRSKSGQARTDSNISPCPHTPRIATVGGLGMTHPCLL